MSKDETISREQIDPKSEEAGRAIYIPFVQRTFGQFLDESRVAVAEIESASAAKDAIIDQRNREISALHETIASKVAKIEELEASAKQLAMDLGVARMLLKQAKASGIPQGIVKLDGGGIRLAVELDQDEAGPLLSWAESAGEDPAVYIARQIRDALVMVVSS